MSIFNPDLIGKILTNLRDSKNVVAKKLSPIYLHEISVLNRFATTGIRKYEFCNLAYSISRKYFIPPSVPTVTILYETPIQTVINEFECHNIDCNYQGSNKNFKYQTKAIIQFVAKMSFCAYFWKQIYQEFK